MCVEAKSLPFGENRVIGNTASSRSKAKLAFGDISRAYIQTNRTLN